MNFPSASRGVSMYDKFDSNAASYGELNPADFAIYTTSPHYNLCNLRNLWIKFLNWQIIKYGFMKLNRPSSFLPIGYLAMLLNF
jgi:hypothetical protein